MALSYSLDTSSRAELLTIPADESPERKASLIGMDLAGLEALAAEMGEPRFRAQQLHHWLYVKCIRDWDQMTNLAKAFKEKMCERFTIGCLEVAEKQISADGTVKYLFRLPDGKLIESVLMYFKDRNVYSICLSSQVGCAMKCSFCATGMLGFSRNLTTAEIVEQYLYVQADSGQEIRNIVFMGQGEPLLNMENLLPAIRILNKSAEVGMRHITVSTSGVVPQIQQLAEEDLQMTLAISLHAPDNETRETIMPINKKWPLEILMPALLEYMEKTGRRLTIEYILLAGINDMPHQAHQLGQLLKPLKCNVNLIPYNPIEGDTIHKRPSRESILRFSNIVMGYGKKVTVRLERGVDIAAACGQLANKHQASQQ